MRGREFSSKHPIDLEAARVNLPAELFLHSVRVADAGCLAKFFGVAVLVVAVILFDIGAAAKFAALLPSFRLISHTIERTKRWLQLSS